MIGGQARVHTPNDMPKAAAAPTKNGLVMSLLTPRKKLLYAARISASSSSRDGRLGWYGVYAVCCEVGVGVAPDEVMTRAKKDSRRRGVYRSTD